MRKDNPRIEQYRVKTGPFRSTAADGNNGAFFIPLGKGQVLAVQVSDGGGWDHVSASLFDRCPTWEEMCRVKDLFFDPEEVVVQYHPAASTYVNNHPHCLHLFRPQAVALPTPPAIMVGVR